MSKAIRMHDDFENAVDVVPQTNGHLQTGGRTAMERRVATRHVSNMRAIDTTADETDQAMIRLGGLGARYIDIQRRLTNYGNDIAEAQVRKDDYEYLAGVGRAARELVSQGNQRLIAAYVQEADKITRRPAIEADTRPRWEKLLIEREE
jgi:hypothetical protein